MNIFAPGYRPNITESPEAKAEIAKGFYAELETAISSFGGELTADMNQVYNTSNNQELIVRREDPVRILESLEEGDDLVIGQKENLGEYANALSWKSSYGSNGLRHAFLEGHGQYLGIVTVIGFRKGDQLTVSPVTNLLKESSSPDRDLIRSVSGRVQPQDIAFIAIRIPVQRFNRSLMTENELDTLEEWEETEKEGREPLFIYRGASFNQVQEAKQAA